MKYFAVTGCDTGFGRLLTEMLDKQGYGVFAGVFMEKSIDEIEKSCSSNVIPLQLDVTDEENVKKFAKDIEDYLQSKPGAQLDGLVNNAGILIAPGPTEWQSLDSYQKMFQVNVLGTVATTKYCLPMIRKSKGRIVNVASIAGRVALPTQAAYNVSKYGVEAYSDTLRREVQDFGVTVHIIEPGVFPNTGLYSTFQTGLDRVWESQPEHIKRDYGEEFYKFQRKLMGFTLNSFGTTNSRLVPEAMIEALTSEHPKYRYRVGFDSKYIITFLTKLHESSQDFIFTLDTGQVKVSPPASAPKGGKKIAQSRYNKGSWAPHIILALIVGYVVYKLRSKA